MTGTSRPKRAVILIIAVCYAVAATLSHDWAQQFVISVQKEPAWTWSALAGVVILLFSLALFFVRRWPEHTSPRRNRTLALSWIMTAGMIGFAQWLLVSVHTEAIHYLQYGILTGLVFSVVRRAHTTLILVVVVGMLDEAYQYWFLYPNWPVYYDINDVLLNTLAGGLMLLFLVSTVPASFRQNEAHDRWLTRNFDLVVLASISFLLVAGIASGLIALYRFPIDGSNEALLILNRNGPSTRFWYHAWWSGRYYHPLSLANGMVAVVLIVQFYRFTLPLLLLRDEKL